MLHQHVSTVVLTGQTKHGPQGGPFNVFMFLAATVGGCVFTRVSLLVRLSAGFHKNY